MRLPLLVTSCWLCHALVLAAEPAPLKLLFLGDNGPHRPVERFVLLEPVLRSRGIHMQYTDDPALALKTEHLQQFDGLVLYANIDVITPEQEQVLLDFVAQGKGFIPLHCASYCFRNSAKYIELVGAQFQRHGAEVFKVENAAPEHPIMHGYKGFESWDETYIHSRHHDQDRVILEYRVQGPQAEGRKQEPWTWVRTHGRGRVFYTAWGHDQRTWSQPGFQELVERGIRWACGQDPRISGSASLTREPFTPLPMTAIPKDLPPFEHLDVGPKIPNYTPGERWGTQGRPLTQMQKPLPPELSLRHYSVPQGFHLELFAAEPDLGGKPIAMTWDERGRLWVCETSDYPNELHPRNRGRDRIRICEDADGDGRADQFTVFAEELSIPTSLAFHRGGVIVQNGTETLYLKDTNGDGRADLREVLITGWNMSDTHGGVSNFQYGLDNWIWAMQGYNNSQPKFGEQTATPFRMGFFRFKLGSREGYSASDLPAVTALEFLRSTDNNTWGLGISEEGLVFGSTANRNPSVFLAIPNRYYERVRGWSPEVLRTIADTYLFNAITPKVRQVDQFGGYTAGAGHALYTARTYPQTFWNRTAFVCEPTGHLVGTFVLQPRGADFSATSPMNLVASDDEWAAPIMAEVGPDGHVWILDWYNFIVQHNPTPEGFRTGKGNAYESDLRDKKHGRIYRLVYGETSRGWKPVVLSPEDPQQLVQTLRHDNMLWRRHAQRLLVERQQPDVVPQLLQLVADPSVDAIGLNVGAIHALWTLHGLGVITPDQPAVWSAATSALKHPSAGVRRNAVLVLPPTEATESALLSSGVLHDADPQVRLAAFLALADLPASERVGRVLAELLRNPVVVADRWWCDALTSAAAIHAQGVFAGLGQSSGKLPEKSTTIMTIVATHVARGRPTGEELSHLLVSAASDAEVLQATLDGFVQGWPHEYAVQITPEAESFLLARFETAPTELKGAMFRLAPALGWKGIEGYAAELTEKLLETIASSQAPEEDRIARARDLIRFQPQSDDVAARLLKVISPQTPTSVSVGLISALVESQAPHTAELLIDRFSTLTPALRQAALRVLLARQQTTAAFLTAVESGQLQLSELSLDQKQSLANHPDPGLRRRAGRLLSQQGGLPNPDRQKVLEELRYVAEQSGDPVAGKEVFKKQCAKCHTHSGEGTRIGPDLTGMAVHPKHELLVHILDPSRSVEGNFRVYTVATTDGRVITGMLASETKTAIEVIDTEAKRHAIPREDIEELVGSPKSLMPEGFEKQATPEDLKNLLEFLTQRGQYVPLDLRKVATAVSTKGMFVFEQADVERLIFSDWSPKVVEGVPFQLIDPQGDRVPNVILFHSTNGTFPPRMPKSVSLPCNMPARAIHLLSGVAGWGFPFGEKGSVSLIVRVHYADGQIEDHELKNGEHFADYIRVVEVPKSKLAFRLRGQQIRYLSVVPQRAEKIESIELIKGPDATAPVVMAITLETR